MENMDWKTFTAIPNGTRVLNHGWDQCVAAANLYHEDVIGGAFVPVPSAYMWWTRFGEFPQLTQNYTPRSTPVAGAIFVSRYGLYDAPNGHIGVVTSVNSNGTFNTMEQNAGVWRYVGRYTRDMTNMLGFLHPKNNPATNTPNTEISSEEADDVKAIFYKEGKLYVVGLFNDVSGFFTTYSTEDSGYNNRIAGGLRTGSFVQVTKSHFEAIKRDCANTRQGK